MLERKQIRTVVFNLLLCLSWAASSQAQPGQDIAPGWGNFSGASFSSRSDNLVGAFMFYW